MPEVSRSMVDPDAPLVIPLYMPRRGVFPIPSSGSLDEPLVCFKVNAQWVGHIIGVFDALDQPDAWNGTATAIEDARAEVRKIIASMEVCDEVFTDLRIQDCIIQVLVGGEWVDKADITSCVDSRVTGTADEEFRDRPWDEPTDEDKPEPTNSLDCVWGGAVSVVDYAFAVFNKALDVLEAAADAADAASTWITDIPGFSYVPPAQAFEGFSTGLTITVAICRLADTPESRDRLACDLFCKIRSGGDPYQLTDEIISSWIDSIADLSTEFPPQVYSPGLGFMVTVLRGLIGRRYIYQRYLLGLNNCEDDWMILCTDCPEPELLCFGFDDMTDLTIIVGSLTSTDGQPQPSALTASGVNSATYPFNGSGANNGIAVAVEVAFASPVTVNSVAFDYKLTVTSGGTNTIALGARFLDAMDAEIDSESTSNSNGNGVWHNQEFDGFSYANVSKVIVYLQRFTNPITTGTGFIDNICISVD